MAKTTKKYRVRPNNQVKHGAEAKSVATYKPGEVIDLSEEEAAEMPWAVELVPEDKAAAPAKAVK